MGLEDEQTVIAKLCHEQKSKEATIARLTIEVQTLTLTIGIEELHENLAAAESKSKERDASNEAINQVRTEEYALGCFISSNSFGWI